MSFDINTITDDEMFKKCKDLFKYHNFNSDCISIIVKHNFTKSFNLLLDKNIQLLWIFTVVKVDLYTELINLCREINLANSKKITLLDNLELAEFLVDLDYDFNYLFQINNLDVLKYLINHGKNFNPNLTVDNSNYLSLTANFETFKYHPRKLYSNNSY